MVFYMNRSCINGSINVERMFIEYIYIVINISLNMFNVEIDLNFC